MEVLNIKDDSFDELLKANEKVVVKFYAGWCGSCRLIAPKYKNLAADEAHNKVTFIEVDAENNPKVRALAKVNNLPFFASFKNGEFIDGFPTSKIEAVEEMINNL